ncbi:hypothetical protein [Nostoc sp. TCL26-01]|uniref:hypothetical protein n=1 Tax=Nostoc sp. TCL26-01 TaxID=2576904 RepID=UPI0015BAE0BE|nr:hypothetical protein [Nostoc sp. TCL26-01]QLE58677.1 hypothetical protein FD725_26160 [Nostoc sp. TCL26-01]
MDFIKKLIGGIVSFVTGLVGFISGLLPKKKSNGYYLELKEDSTQTKPVVPAASNGTKVAAPVEAPPVKEPTPAPVVAETSAEPAPAPAKTKAKAKAKAKAPKKSENGKTAAPAEPVAAPVAKAQPVTPTETTFAPKYLAPSASGSNGRRLPGANMSTFLDMARQVKTPG